MTAIEWRSIPGHPNYEASADGRIRRARPGKGTHIGRVLATPSDTNGYPTVNIDGSPWRVHVLVALAFIGPVMSGAQVHHRNEDRSDCRSSNLEIVPSPLAHGERHRRKHLTRRRHGESNPAVRCACGCSKTFPKFDSGGRPRRFVSGHNLDRDRYGRFAAPRGGGAVA